MLFTHSPESVTAVAGTSRELKCFTSVEWIQEAAKEVGGRGGGRPHMAQAGGKDPKSLPKAKQKAMDFAKAKLSG